MKLIRTKRTRGRGRVREIGRGKKGRVKEMKERKLRKVKRMKLIKEGKRKEEEWE